MHLTHLSSTSARRRVRNRMKVRKSGRPRLSVSRSNKHILAQVIDDQAGKTVAAAYDLQVKNRKGLTKLEIAREVGKLVAERAVKAGITEVVFDRGSYVYHGRVKAIAEAARENGLQF